MFFTHVKKALLNGDLNDKEMQCPPTTQGKVDKGWKKFYIVQSSIHIYGSIDS